VLLSIEEYQRLTRQRRNIADALAMPDVADIERLHAADSKRTFGYNQLVFVKSINLCW